MMSIGSVVQQAASGNLLALQSSWNRERTSAPANSFSPPQPSLAQPELNPELECRLGSIGPVQFAFRMALRTAETLERAYLFDPIR